MYIIVETQTTGGQTAVVTPASYADKNQADSAYYTKLAAAARSTVPIHAVIMFNEHGIAIRSDYYEHGDNT